MTYDQWKCTDPRDYEYGYDDEAEDCPCDEFEIDWEGLATCDRCSRCWRASTEEIKRDRELRSEYDAWSRKQERREFLRRLTYPIRWPIYRLLERIWPRKACRVLLDEEIPF